jgi:hypothetical protein
MQTKKKDDSKFNGYPEEVILNAYDYSNPNYDLGFWRSHKLSLAFLW